MNRRRNLLILAAGLLLIIVIGYVEARPKGDGITTRVVTIVPTRFATKLPETGVVQRPRTTTLAALVPGNLEAVLVKPGQRVRAGQLLATLSNPSLVNAEADAHDAYVASSGRARTAQQTNATLPTANRSAVVQAAAQLQQARFALNQAMQDERAGAQSGLGYGGASATLQRAQADAAVATAQTDFREATRIAEADRTLYAEKALSRDALDAANAKLDQARVAFEQAKRSRNETYAQISRQGPVLSARVRADRDAVAQAEAALAAARANAAQDKSGDVTSATADAAQRLSDWRYAADQVARLRIVAPYDGIVQNIANQSGDTLRPLQPGDPVTVGQALVTIAADAGFVVRARVDEQDVSGVRIGQSANVSGEDLGTTTLPGHVATIGAVAQKSDDPSNTARQVVTTIALDRTVPFLRDGMSVDVDIITQSLPAALVVPADALRRDTAGKPYVLIVRDRHARKQPVVLGAANDAQTVVKSGLHVGDVIVAERNAGIIDGSGVSPTSAPSVAPSTKP